MSALLALWLLLADPLGIDEKHAIALDVCDDIAATFDYHGCMSELDEDGVRAWLHLLCFVWDPQLERGVYDEAAIIAYRWEHGMMIKVSSPYLIGCPRYS